MQATVPSAPNHPASYSRLPSRGTPPDQSSVSLFAPSFGCKTDPIQRRVAADSARWALRWGAGFFWAGIPSSLGKPRKGQKTTEDRGREREKRWWSDREEEAAGAVSSSSCTDLCPSDRTIRSHCVQRQRWHTTSALIGSSPPSSAVVRDGAGVLTHSPMLSVVCVLTPSLWLVSAPEAPSPRLAHSRCPARDRRRVTLQVWHRTCPTHVSLPPFPTPRLFVFRRSVAIFRPPPPSEMAVITQNYINRPRALSR